MPPPAPTGGLCGPRAAARQPGARPVPPGPHGTPGIPSVTVPSGDSAIPAASRVRRRDRHGRGLRGMLTPAHTPPYRSRAERLDDLVLQAVSQLEPRWETELSGIEFAVEEIPAAEMPDDEPDPVPLARLDPGSADAGNAEHPARPARIVLYR